MECNAESSRCEKWLAAVKLEFDTLVKMGCWEVVDIPIDAPLLGVRWVYKINPALRAPSPKDEVK